MKLNKLIESVAGQIYGNQEIEIRGISAHSKQIGPGFLFVAKRQGFILEAVSAGAVAVVADSYNASLIGITQIIHPNPAEVELLLANRFYASPAQKLQVIGVTGTNGKTTTTYIIRHFLGFLGKSCGLIGTVAWITGRKIQTPTHTTPDTLTLMRLFSEMVQAGDQAVAMEVSSHALCQKRVKGIDFQVGVFTNLSQDHLDYHGTMENYAAAKAHLFQSLKEDAWAVVNSDDPMASCIVNNCKAHLLTYGLSTDADLYATDIQFRAQGMEFKVHCQGQSADFKTQLIGRFNIYNILAAATVSLIQGHSLEDLSNAVLSLPPVPGRLERVANAKNLNIFVDYSHTPDALEKALQTLQEMRTGKVIVVYGCGGDRDPYKRPLMGAIAERLSDIAILTSDNPRSEDPSQIAKQVLQGCLWPEKTVVELDRQKAIEKAVALSSSEDIILIAGKGHEKEQIFADRTIPFDDREVARRAAKS